MAGFFSTKNAIASKLLTVHPLKFYGKLAIFSLAIIALLAGLAYGSSTGIVARAESASPHIVAPANSAVLTYKNGLSRTGQFSNEVTLNINNVNQNQFGKRVSYPVDGQVYAEPLYVPNLTINGGVHNVVFVATQHDSVYAFDADQTSVTAPLWHKSFLGPNVTSVSSSSVSCGDISPEYGISSTPVIDSSTNTMYLVANTLDNGTNTYRIHALDITTGADKHTPTVIKATANGTGVGGVNGVISFNPTVQGQRVGLLLTGNRIYMGFGSHCDRAPDHGWLMSYDASSLQQIAAYNDTKGGNQGGIWEAGDGIAADTLNHIYVMTGNGTFNRNTGGLDLGDSFIKLDITNGALKVVDYFTPFNQACLQNGDIDLGSGGTVLLPGNEVLGVGKQGRIYILNQGGLGGYHTISNPCSNQGLTNVDQIVQETPLNTANGGVWGTPAFWNGSNGQYVFTGGVADHIKAFKFSGGKISTSSTTHTSETLSYPGSNPVVSSNGTTAGTGILWALDKTATLHAYDATNLGNELYNSNQNASRDALGSYVKFSVPTVANGEVFAGTKNSLNIYGELGPPVPAVYNNAGVSDDNNPTGANFDGSGASYSQQALAAASITPNNPVVFHGVTFIWPNVASGVPDNYQAQGQIVNYTSVPNATTLAFLGAANNGPSTGTATITFTDTTTQTFTLAFSDWTLNGGTVTSPIAGNQIVATMAYRNTPTGQQMHKPSLFYTDVAIPNNETVKSVTLPGNTDKGAIHVFAIGSK